MAITVSSVIVASSQSVPLAMQNNSTRSRTDSAAATSAGVEDRFRRVVTAGSRWNHFHRLLRLALNVTTAVAVRAPPPANRGPRCRAGARLPVGQRGPDTAARRSARRVEL